MQAKSARTAYLGPEGTFSYFTGLSWLNEPELVPFADFNALFRAVEGGDCVFGLVPLENSLRGSIGQNFDLFMRHNVKILGEAFSRINNCLLSREKSLEDIRVVYSHAQPLAQCADWLALTLPWARVIPSPSTAAAAAQAAKEEASAAIGHRLLASMTGLNILAEDIEDEKDNWTRFVLIAPAGAAKMALPAGTIPGDWKTTFIFTVEDKPGALASVLLALERHGVNMRKLESRPLRGGTTGGGNWKYAFFSDVECDLTSPEQAEALRDLYAACGSLHILGSYPHGPELDMQAPGVVKE